MVSLVDRLELRKGSPSPRYAEILSSLKGEQDLLDSRKDDLLQRFVSFRDGMLEGLYQFTSEAAENGLRGVRICTVKRSCDRILEAELTLNHVDLVLVAPGLMLPVQPGDTTLVAKILVYVAGDDDRRPLVEIAVYQDGERYQYGVHTFTAEGATGPLRGGYDVNAGEGHRAAQDLIQHLYSFDASWQERPTLGALRTLLGRQGKGA